MKRIVIYLRLSKEDDLNRDESNSISNQRELIKRFIRKDKNLRQMEVVEIKDDGYTGKNMNRPGMQQLLELIRKRQVQVVIVKDMSRFSRDYLVLGQYTEICPAFPEIIWYSGSTQSRYFRSWESGSLQSTTTMTVIHRMAELRK